MVLEYFSSKKAKKQDAQTPKTPVLSEEEEQFLKQITDEAPPPLPARPTVILDNGAKVEGKDAQIALMDGADQIPLPTSPPVDDAPGDKKGKAKSSGEKKTMRDYWNYVPTIPARMKSMTRKKTADDIKSADNAAKTNQSAEIKPGAESKSEEDDLTNILDQLNLAAVNNRAFSFTKESQELMDKFKVVLKDLINGVPTAYDDLEKLLTGSEKQLSAMFAAMPPFIQTLIKSLPAKVTASLGPEVLAASAEKPGLAPPDGKGKKKRRFRTPSLKTLVGEQGAVVTMLRSIFNFLKLRFPAAISGTSVLLSLAVFLLLFVFWYCHKRGKETRLERERLAGESAEVSESDMSGLEESGITEKSATTEKANLAADGEKSNPALADLPSVRDLPSPAATPLPQTPQPQAAGEKPKTLAA